MVLRETDLSWASGFFEGEGNISLTKHKAPLVNVTQCNREPLEKLQDLFGGTIYGPRRNINSAKDFWVWSLTKHSDSINFLRQISPWMSDLRLADALQKIEYYINIREVRLTFCGKGHDKDEVGWRPGNNGGRVCKRCESDRKKAKV